MKRPGPTVRESETGPIEKKVSWPRKKKSKETALR